MTDATRQQEPTSTPPGGYRMSVIVPTYARPRALRSCLDALAGQSYDPNRFEVLIIDDGSPRPLDAIVEAFRERMNVRLLRQENAGPGAARNAGAVHARGRFLAFTDDDCRPAPDWLARLDKRLCDAPECLVGGRTSNALEDELFSTVSQLIIDLAYAHYNPSPERATFFAGNNLAISRQGFHEIGGFDPGFRVASEDRDLCDRWRHHGGRLLYAPDAVVAHAHPLTLGGFVRQHFAYGRGAHRYHRVRRTRGSGRLYVDVSFHMRLPRLLRAPLSRLPWRKVGPVLAALFLWQVANASGYFYERFRATPNTIAGLPA